VSMAYISKKLSSDSEIIVMNTAGSVALGAQQVALFGAIALGSRQISRGHAIEPAAFLSKIATMIGERFAKASAS
jgi:hypothetical protein